jgi:hypothetical protein
MVDIASRLSGGHQFVRVDLYEVDKKVYFGELTFTPGNMNFFTENQYLKMGDKIDLKKVKKRKTLFLV